MMENKKTLEEVREIFENDRFATVTTTGYHLK